MTDSKLASVVMQSIGEASMCWEAPEKAGVFQSERAIEVGEKLIEEIESRSAANKDLLMDLTSKGLISKQSLLTYLGFDFDEEVKRIRMEHQLAKECALDTDTKENRVIDDLKRLQRLGTEGSKANDKLRGACATVAMAIAKICDQAKGLPIHFSNATCGNQNYYTNTNKLNPDVFEVAPHPLYVCTSGIGSIHVYMLNDDTKSTGPLSECDLLNPKVDLKIVVKFAKLIADGYLDKLANNLSKRIEDDEQFLRGVLGECNKWDFLGRQQLLRVPDDIKKEYMKYAYDNFPENITIDEVAKQNLNIQQRTALAMLEWLIAAPNRREGRSEVWAFFWLKMAMQNPGSWIEVRELDSTSRAQRENLFDRIKGIVMNSGLSNFELDKGGWKIRYTSSLESQK